jgi:phospholipase C
VTQAKRPLGWAGSVFVIVMENHSSGEIIGSPDAPTINALASGGAVAAGYHDPYVHPSEPNYLWMVAGENFGILNDNDPGPANTIASTSHVADQIDQAGLTWRAYEEDMGTSCALVSHGNYAAKHDPFVYFDDLNGWDGASFSPTERCRTHVVDFSQLPIDISNDEVPTYVFITPNLQHDMHDGTISEGDSWLASVLPMIQSSPAYIRGGVIFLLWDEGSGQSDDPPFIVASPNARHIVSDVAYDTSSFLLTAERILGIDELPCSPSASSTASMDDLFSVKL